MRARRPICAHKVGDARGGVEREDREGLEGGGEYAEVAEDAEGAEKRGLGGQGMGLVPSFEPGDEGG